MARRARSSALSTSIIVWVESWTAAVEDEEEADGVRATEARGGSEVEGAVKTAPVLGVVVSRIAETDAEACECDRDHAR